MKYSYLLDFIIFISLNKVTPPPPKKKNGTQIKSITFRVNRAS